MSQRGIWVVTGRDRPDNREDGSKWGMDAGPSYGDRMADLPESKQTWIDAGDLKHNVDEFVDVVEDAFASVDRHHNIQLQEIELSVEVTATGKLALLGSGAELGGKGSIKLKFTRRQ